MLNENARRFIHLQERANRMIDFHGFCTEEVANELEELADKEPKMFAAMYQGIPIADGERVFETWMFDDRVLDAKLIPKLSKWHRGWDTAYTTNSGSDHSASVLFAFDQHENLHLRGFVKKRVPLNEITNWASKIARMDPPNTDQIVEKHNAGYAVYEYLRRQPGLAPFVVMQKVTGTEGKFRIPERF